MLARINSVETAADKLPGLVQFCQDQLPAFRDAPGMRGFYLLADRQSGKIVTISLWDSTDDLRKNDEARGIQVRKEATSELGIAATPVEIYEVLMQA